MKPRLLVVDDAPDIHALLEVRLRPEGLRIEHAASGEEGLAMALSSPPDLILLDVEMPDMSGLDVCRRLKANAATLGVPVIFLTGASDVDTKVHGFDLGAVDYVTKPFEPAELRARVRAALRTKRYQDLLATRASIDGLTGLFTRRSFDERLDAEVEASERTRKGLSLVMIDVDHFKRLNDAHGHPFGDRVLQVVAEALNGALGPGESAYRYGGEEFAVLLSGAGPAQAAVRAAQLLTTVRDLTFPLGRDTVRITASFGVATHGPAHATAASLVAAADRALYAAKASGRNRVVTAPPGQPSRWSETNA